MRTALIIGQLQAVLESSLNTQITAEATLAGKTVGLIVEFSQGYEDPLRLTKYNACLICPDQIRKDNANSLSINSIDLILAISARTKEAVMDAMEIYTDAIANLVDADPTLGGNVFEAQFESAEFAGPLPGNGMIGAVIIRLTIRADDLLV